MNISYNYIIILRFQSQNVSVVNHVSDLYLLQHILKTLREKKSRPLREINHKRNLTQKGTTSNCNVVSKQSNSCDTKERPFQCNVHSKRLDKL